MDKTLILDQIILNIEQGNYTCEFINGGYSYSNEITDVFKILQLKEYETIYEDNTEFYNYAKKKELDQNINPEEYSLIDCIIVLNWIWHLESGIAVGIVKKKIENGSYLKTLKQLRKFIV